MPTSLHDPCADLQPYQGVPSRCVRGGVASCATPPRPKTWSRRCSYSSGGAQSPYDARLAGAYVAMLARSRAIDHWRAQAVRGRSTPSAGHGSGVSRSAADRAIERERSARRLDRRPAAARASARRSCSRSRAGYRRRDRRRRRRAARHREEPRAARAREAARERGVTPDGACGCATSSSAPASARPRCRAWESRYGFPRARAGCRAAIAATTSATSRCCASRCGCATRASRSRPRSSARAAASTARRIRCSRGCGTSGRSCASACSQAQPGRDQPRDRGRMRVRRRRPAAVRRLPARAPLPRGAGALARPRARRRRGVRVRRLPPRRRPAAPSRSRSHAATRWPARVGGDLRRRRHRVAHGRLGAAGPGRAADSSRRFETLWTADRETARAAARICCDLALDGARDLSSRSAEPPRRAGGARTDELRRAEALTAG